MNHDGGQAAAFTDDALEQARSLIGVWLRRDVHWPAITEPISQHDIRRWSLYSVGDDNPLFCDPSYGASSVWGSTIAPPTLLYAVDSTIVAPGLPGIQWIYGGTRWRFHRVVRPGDRISARARVVDVQEKRGTHAPRFVVQTGEVLYVDERQRLVARAEADVLRVPRRRSGEGLRGFEERERSGRQHYSDEEIEAIRQAYLTEGRRGAEPRYWEDVQVSDPVGPIVKGPLTLVDIVAFYAGRRSTYNPLRLAFLERERHPRNVYVSPSTNIPMHPAAGHFDAEIAHEVGMADAYDQGWMRANWAGHLLTAWMGDWGFVSDLRVRLTIPNMVGDVTWVRGEVTGKRRSGEAHLVEVRLWGENQRGQRNLEGGASVRLPSREPSDRFLLDLEATA